MRVNASAADGWNPPGSAGEFLSISERLVISPVWGRFHRAHMEEGHTLRRGELIGRVVLASKEVRLVSPMRAVFLGWLVLDGERVSPGRPVVWLRAADDRHAAPQERRHPPSRGP